MKKRGFGFVEILMAGALLLLLLSIVTKIFSVTADFFQVGTSRVNLYQELRIALDWIKKDVRESGFNLDVGSNYLKIAKVKVDDRGVPIYDPDGWLADGELIEYCFVPSGYPGKPGLLKRNDRTLLTQAWDVKFTMRMEMINNLKITSIAVEMLVGSSRTTTNSISFKIFPRHLASWAQHRYWASITNGQRIKYVFK